MDEFVKRCLKRRRLEGENACITEAHSFVKTVTPSSVVGLSDIAPKQKGDFKKIFRYFKNSGDCPYHCLEAPKENSELNKPFQKVDNYRIESAAALVSLPCGHTDVFTQRLPALLKDTVLCSHTCPSTSAPFSVLAVDIETTGLSLKIDQIIELGCVELRWNGCDVCMKGRMQEDYLTGQWVRGGRMFHRLVRPTVRVTCAAAAVHNLSDKALQTAPHWKEVAKDFKAFCDEFPTRCTEVSDMLISHGGNHIDPLHDSFTFPPLIAHNAQFDGTFIEKCLMRLGYTVYWHPLYPITCTKRLAQQLYPKRMSSLDHVSAFLGISGAFQRMQSSHSAYVDAIQCAKVFLHLAHTLNTHIRDKKNDNS